MSVETFKKVRERLGWTQYKMAKELDISQTQYKYLEEKAKSCQTKILLKLFEVSEMSDSDFWKLFRATEKD